MAQPSISLASLAQAALEAARALGFDLAAILPVAAPDPLASEAHPLGGSTISPRAASRYRAWVEQGFHGEMAYLSQADSASKRLCPENLLPGLRSILVVGINYHTTPVARALMDDPSRGAIASYAWGIDYHTVLADKLSRLAASIAVLARQPVAHRAFVDTGPVLERELADRAGLGFLGKNTCLISPGIGSWLFLGELFLSLELPASLLSHRSKNAARPSVLSCGRCSRCLQACPTGALVAPHVLDSRRCISYLTIELKGSVPRELRPLLGNRVFGCDVCQGVCPWNRRFARPTSEPGFAPGVDSIAPRLLDLLALDDDAFSRRFHGSPVRRARRRGLLRNAAVALGNWGSADAVPALVQALHDAEPLVRGHSAWALGRIQTPDARCALESALPGEANRQVRAEISLALVGR